MSVRVGRAGIGDEHTFDVWVQYTAPNGKVKAVRPKLVAKLTPDATRAECGLVINEKIIPGGPSGPRTRESTRRARSSRQTTQISCFFPYTREGILNLLNHEICCDFTHIIVTDGIDVDANTTPLCGAV